MINDLDIVQWEYLLSPEFELINSAGKPLTGGWIEVYLHGTRNKYYCASDFSGTLHPFQIPLDSIGANVVLADPNNAYDVYVYNKYGSLIMSRYNVKCHGGGSGSSTYVGDRLYYGQFKATDVATQAGLTRVKGNIDVDDGKLELKQDMSYHITLRGEFVVNDVSNVDTVLSYIEYSAVKPINVNVDYTKDGSQYFEISYDIYRLAEDMDYPVSFLQSNGLVKNLAVEVHSLSNLATTASGAGSEYEPGWGIVIQNSVISVDPSILEEYATHDEVINAVTSINLDEYATHDEVYNSSVTAINLVTGMIPETQVQSDWDQDDDNAPDYIKNKPHIPEIELNSGDQVTAIDGHTLAGTGGSEYNEGFGIDIDNGTISIDTNIVALASAIPPAQVQSDWDQSDDTQIDYIKNKPDLEVYSTHEEVYNATVTAVQVATGAIPELPEEEEVVFEEINLSDYALASAIPDVSNFTTHTEVYEATVTAVQVATAAIPEEEEVEFEEINLNDYALASAIPDVSNLASHTEVYEATVTAINLVTGIMPEAQVQSDWAQNDSNQVDYIKNKPDEYDLVAGQNVSISVSGTNVVISSTGGSGGGGTYSEGFGIDISNNEIAIDPSIVALASADPNIFFAHVKATNTSYTSTTEYTSYADVKAAYDAGKIIYCVLHTPLNWIYAVLPLVSASNHDSAQSSGDLSLIFIAYSSEIWKKIYVVEYDGMMKTVFLRAFDSQADWNQQYSNHPNYIKNKPSIPEIELNDDSQVTAIDGHALAGGSGGTSYTPGTGIDITNDVISVDNTVALKTDIPDVSNLATKTELTSVSGTLQTEIEAVSAIIPDEEAVEFEEINISDYALASAIPDTSDMATKTWVGNQGYLTEVPNTYATDTEVYNATVTAINVATGVIPDTEDVTFEEVDLSDYALTSAIPDVSNFTTHAEVYVATVTAVQVATGVIPDTSDMATKTWVGNQGYLTSVPSNYVTETELTGAVSGFQNKLTGINDVQVVASLPASPVSNTLYLIPEGV